MCENNKIMIDDTKVDIIKMIFERYMAGDSLGEIAATLSNKQIVSPSGKSVWSGAAIDRLLSNKKYIHHIVSREQFIEAQFEKTRRSSIDADT